ncbi:MAG: helix-turn-helix domain-containing protein [Planctomycetes bacterium]|nr:helix-turn-helix domain-containing protein [Planctomycetota bacterium]
MAGVHGCVRFIWNAALSVRRFPDIGIEV